MSAYRLVPTADQSSLQSTAAGFMITSPAPQKVASWAGEVFPR